MKTLNEQERRLIWDAMLDADLAARYYTILARRYELRDRILGFLSFILASGVVGSFILEFGDHTKVVQTSIAVATMIISGVTLIYRFDHSAAQAALLFRQFTEVLAQYESLWARIDEVEPSETRSAFDRLRASVAVMSEDATREFGDKRKLALRAQQQVLESRGLAYPSHP